MSPRESSCPKLRTLLPHTVKMEAIMVEHVVADTGAFIKRASLHVSYCWWSRVLFLNILILLSRNVSLTQDKWRNWFVRAGAVCVSLLEFRINKLIDALCRHDCDTLTENIMVMPRFSTLFHCSTLVYFKMFWEYNLPWRINKFIQHHGEFWQPDTSRLDKDN